MRAEVFSLSDLHASRYSEFLNFPVNFYWEDQNRWEKGVFGGVRFSSRFAESVAWVTPRGRDYAIPVRIRDVQIVMPSKTDAPSVENAWTPFKILESIDGEIS